MSKMNTTRVSAIAEFPNVTPENVANPETIAKALGGDTKMMEGVGKSGIRTYGYLYSVVALSEISASEICETYGAKSSRMTKAKKVVDNYLLNVLDLESETLTYGHYQDAIEWAIENFSSLNSAYDAIDTEEKAPQTLATKVSDLMKWANKHGHSPEDVYKEVARQISGV